VGDILAGHSDGDMGSGMSDEPKKRLWRWSWWAVFWLLLLGYPLSLGPATRYACHSADPLATAETVNTVYAPIVWITEQSEWAQNAVRWYAEAWAPELKR
jgi:hypothetical protein